jgi:hypothetical protein
MKKKLWFSFALLVFITTFWCGSSFATSVVIGGYTASYGSNIVQLPPSDPIWLKEWGAVVGSGYTNFEASSCAVGVHIKMTYQEHKTSGTSTKTKEAYGNNPGGAGGATCSATCSTGNGAMLDWFSPVSVESDHYVTYNGQQYHFRIP